MLTQKTIFGIGFILGIIITGIFSMCSIGYHSMNFHNQHQCFTNEEYENISAYQIYCALQLNASYKDVMKWWNTPLGFIDGNGIYLIEPSINLTDYNFIYKEDDKVFDYIMEATP